MANNYRIKDKVSFEKVTGRPYEIAGLYYFMRLDCLIDLAHKVSVDFFKRPQLYIDLGDVATAQLLARLNARYGSDEEYLSKSQRDAIYVALFGQSSGPPVTNGIGNFPRRRDQLMEAATAFAERVYDTGVEMLRERVRTTHRPFKEDLLGLQGSSLTWSRTQSLPRLTERTAYRILRDKGVAAVFGITARPEPPWPFVEDSNGDKLVEELSKQLSGDNEPGMPITRAQFSDLQRAALRGAEAITAILDYTEGAAGDKAADDEDLDTLITKVYTWSAAERSLQSV